MTNVRVVPLEERDNPRLGLIRRAVIYIPAAILLTSLLVVAILSLPGSLIAALLLAVGALAMDVEAYQSSRDLLSPGPITSRGIVRRRWKKSRILFLGRVHYLLLESRPVTDGVVDEQAPAKRRLFEIRPLTALEVDPGDELEVVHWPHTNTIVSVTRLRRASDTPLRRPSLDSDED